VTNVAWSPDGDRLLSSSLDGTIDLWDVDRHSRIVQVTAAGPGVPTVAWFRDGGATIAAADEHGGLWTFPIDTAEWQHRACEIAGRNLTAAEWEELLPSQPYRRTCPDEPPAPD
jgi:WD40 repeat protein